jgi:ATP-dependent DNA helicase PIF1
MKMLAKELECTVLSKEQQDFIQEIEESGENYFITGKAGTGKSTVLQGLKKSTKKKFVVAAPTGVAALNVGGQTIHSLFKLSIKFQEPDDIKVNKSTAKLLSKIDMLIIDEVSMLRADILDAMNIILQKSKNNFEPFGGVQVVMFGDLYQLPPIISDNEIAQYFKDKYSSHYFFAAHVWSGASLVLKELTTIFRQDDKEFQSILNSIRIRDFDSNLLNKLNERVQDASVTESIVTLALTNRTVSQINEEALDKISSQAYEYDADISGDMEKSAFPTEETLTLKVGAQVMFLKNDPEQRWVNGTIGEVEYLSDDNIEIKVADEIHEIKKTKWDKIKYSYDESTQKIKEEVVSSFTQYPLRLAWAITVHKSQGQTLNRVIFDIERGAFAHGQTYVALSRCSSFEGLFLKKPIRARDIIVDPRISEFMKSFSSSGSF